MHKDEAWIFKVHNKKTTEQTETKKINVTISNQNLLGTWFVQDLPVMLYSKCRGLMFN